MLKTFPCNSTSAIDSWSFLCLAMLLLAGIDSAVELEETMRSKIKSEC